MRNSVHSPLTLLILFGVWQLNCIVCSSGSGPKASSQGIPQNARIVGSKLKPKIKFKGDLGVLNEHQSHELNEKLRIGRDTYRYYGGSGKGGSSSLLPTSPSKSHFYSSDAYGYGTETQYGNKRPSSKGSSIQDYLQVVDTLDELPSDFGELTAASSSYGGGGHGGG